MNPEWPEIAALLKGRGLGLWLLTSGLSLAKHARQAAGLFQSITVSLDGTCPETYAAIRGLDAFDKVCEGIRAVAALGVRPGLRVTLQRANFRELLRFVSLARELGASQVSFLAVDVSNPHAFARREDVSPHDLALSRRRYSAARRAARSRSRTSTPRTSAPASLPSRLRSSGTSATTSPPCAGSESSRQYAATRPSSPPWSTSTGASRRASSFRRPRARRALRISKKRWRASPCARYAPQSARANGPSAQSACARCGATLRRSRPRPSTQRVAGDA